MFAILLLMTRFLPIIIILLTTFYLIHATNVFAQEITPTVTSASQINPQGSDFENFMKNLLPSFKQIPDTLEQINRSYLPQEVGQEINSSAPAKNPGVAANSLEPQAKEDNKSTLYKAAGEYTIKSGIANPQEVSNASTNILDSLLNFFKNIAENIFNKGEKEAKNSVTNLSQDAKDQVFNQETTIGGKSNTTMGKALPISQCAELPAELSDELCKN